MEAESFNTLDQAELALTSVASPGEPGLLHVSVTPIHTAARRLRWESLLGTETDGAEHVVRDVPDFSMGNSMK